MENVSESWFEFKAFKSIKRESTHWRKKRRMNFKLGSKKRYNCF